MPASRPIHRRTRAASLLAAGALAAGLLAACGAPPSSGGSGGRQAVDAKKLASCPLSALKKAKGKVTVDLWFGGLGGSPTGVLKDMAKKYNASQDKVVVTANNQGNAYEEVLRKYEGASSTPKQLPQIIYLEDTSLGEMVDKGQVLPAQSCMDAGGYDPTQISAAARAHYSVDGVLYPGYMNVSTPVIYYNKVAFQKAGLDPNKPPTTIEEIRKDAEILKEKGVANHPLSFKNDPWFIETWLAGISQSAVNNGNGRTKPPTKATFDTPEAVKVLTFFQKMKKDGLAVSFAKTEGSINQYLALLPQGDKPPESAMLIETSTASSTIRDFLGGKLTAADAGDQFTGANIDINQNQLVPGAGAFPGIESPGKIFASGGAFYMLNTSSPAQQAASWDFLKFMLQPENAYIWHTGAGYLPVVKKVLDNPNIVTFWKDDVAGVMIKHAVDQLQDADPDQSGPLIGPYQDYSKALEDAENNVMLDGADPAKQLKAAEDSVTKTLQDYNGG
ncbi:MAG: putative glycerol-3-phosphate transporter subunit periplasmic-binding component of superfamily [Acidimicrobiales bacterium]|nr:putative glycerol-3-phosphate transporter subunit periplasmic-binding component of superfamily [Acidimicrobiales bacterium]